MNKTRPTGLGLFVLCLLMALIIAPRANSQGVDASSMAVIINLDDPLSIATGNYYIKKRNIPGENVIRLRLGPAKPELSVEAFAPIVQQLKQRTPDHIQAYALAWARPYRVGCMSITSAIALGYDEDYCAQGCKLTRKSGYYNSSSNNPYGDHAVRPAMMLAADNFENARALIDRGVNADYSRPNGNAYLLSTSDRERNVRAGQYPLVLQSLSRVLNIEILHRDWIDKKHNVLFYFTGLPSVRYLDTIDFLPGAVGDHLTSTGGVLFGGGQMSSLEWLRAGATASYGTVVEPCNYPAKFPVPGVLMQHYLNGDSLVEAYWKSVAMPGQGVFIGEPLASPYRGCQLRFSPPGRADRLINRPLQTLVMRASTRCDVSSVY